MGKNKQARIKEAVEASMYKYPYQNMSLVDMTGERWKGIPGIEDYCQVSNMGRIKALERKVPLNFNAEHTFTLPETIRKQSLCNVLPGKRNPILMVICYVHNVKYSFVVRNLVYQAFVGDIELTYHSVIHSNGDYFNCRSSNLTLYVKNKRNRKKEAIQPKFSHY